MLFFAQSYSPNQILPKSDEKQDEKQEKQETRNTRKTRKTRFVKRKKDFKNQPKLNYGS